MRVCTKVVIGFYAYCATLGTLAITFLRTPANVHLRAARRMAELGDEG